LALLGALCLGSTASANELVFDHALHVQENGIECEACHGDAKQATSVKMDLRPSMDTCGDCHDVEDEAECATCHVGDDALSYEPSEVEVDFFSHQGHLQRGASCETCHATEGSDVVRAAAMDDCRGCHTTAAQLSDCSQCHARGAEMIPSSHGAGWESWHGVEARSADNGCQSCHTQSDCQQCHSGDNLRPRVHPTGFEFRHALDAQVSSIECESCHSDRAFCSSCHASRGVIPENHSLADWAVFPDGGEHAMEARLDLESCLLCHEDGTKPVCASCHGD